MKTININIESLSIFILQHVSDIQRKFTKLYINSHVIDNHSYYFIPSSSMYLVQLYRLLQSENIKKTDNIIDAGCGVSPILILLHILNYKNIYGIDIFQPYLDVLNEYVRNDCSLKNADITKHNYSKYKLIYTYMPIVNSVECRDFYKHIMSTMSVDSILVDYYGPISSVLYSHPDKDNFKYIDINNHVIKRIK